MSKQPTRRRRATGAAARSVAVGVAVAALVWSAVTLLAAVALTRARVAGLALEPSLGRFLRRGPGVAGPLETKRGGPVPMNLVHPMVHQAERADGGVEWGCPRCGRYMVFHPLRRVVVVMGDPNIVHLSGKPFPPPEHVRAILSEFDERWLDAYELVW